MFRAARTIGIAEEFQGRAGDGEGHSPLHVGEGDLGREPRRRLLLGVLGLHQDLMRGVGFRRARRFDRGVSLLFEGVQPADQVFQATRLTRQIVRTLLLCAKRVLGRGERLATGVDKRGEPRLFERKRRHPCRKSLPLDRDRVAALLQGIDVMREPLGLGLEIRDHRSEYGGCSHSRRHVARLHQNGGRRIGAHALQRRQKFGDRVSPLFERGSEQIGLRVERFQSLIRLAYSTLGVLNFGGSLDERRSQASAIGANGFDLRLDRAALLFGSADRVLDPPQFCLFLSALLLIDRRRNGIGRGRRIRKRDERPRNRSAHRRGAESKSPAWWRGKEHHGVKTIKSGRNRGGYVR